MLDDEFFSAVLRLLAALELSPGIVCDIVPPKNKVSDGEFSDLVYLGPERVCV